MPTPNEIMESAYQKAKEEPLEQLLAGLPDKAIQNLKTVAENAERRKAVLGVILTSLVYKVYNPAQDIRKHQESMDGGYSGRTFDTKYVTPFLRSKFPHFAMAESAWLTRSLEQPSPYDSKYPGKISNKVLKTAFLDILDQVESNSESNSALAWRFLVALMGLLLEKTEKDNNLLAEVAEVHVSSGVTISKIIEAFKLHIYYDYPRGVSGTARLPVLAIYSVYKLLMSEVKRYEGKILLPLEPHTSPDSRSKSLGDINVNNPVDNTCFESVEIKHNKPITALTVDAAYQKIKDTKVDRYYILTTKEPNFDNYEAVMQKIEQYKGSHPCQIIVNGVIPSLKYYLRLISEPQNIIGEYTTLLQSEYKRASGIKREHLEAWKKILDETKLK